MIGQLPACLLAVAQYYSLPPTILDTIVAVETGHSATQEASPGTDVVTNNRNGTHDHGPGGINDVWMPELAAKTGLDPDTLTTRLDEDYCYNVGIVGYILRLRINDADGDFWKGVGWYHSKTPALAESYRVLIVRKAIKVYGPDIFSAAVNRQ
jgi:hypothetical protein